jgi:hypothetical protein
MTKETGLGAHFYIEGVDISGDIGAMNSIMVSAAEDNVTPIVSQAVERLALIELGEISFMSFFSTDVSATTAHDLFTAADHADIKQALYFHRPTLGAPVAAVIGRRFHYNLVRNADGSIRGDSSIKSSTGARGLEWGNALTAGKVTSTADELLAGLDNTASSAGDLSAYLQVFALSGATNVDVTIWASDDDGSVDPYAEIGTFTLVSAAPAAEQIVIAGPIKRWLAVDLKGTYTTVTLAVAAVRL